MKIKLRESPNLSRATKQEGSACPTEALAKAGLPLCPLQVKKLNLNQAIKETEKVCGKFPNPRKWTSHHRFAELVEEVGELANAIQTKEGYKSTKRQKSEVNDSICDILYEVLMMASMYKVNLDKEYPKVLRQLEKRIKNGEFNHEK